jgi:hypothetical protein
MAGGTSPYTYAWTKDAVAYATTEDITGLAAATYALTVTDNKGCTVTASAVVNQPALLTVAVTTYNNLTCYNSNDGAIDITVGGGTTAYSYAWSNSATTEDLTGLAIGTYTVTVTDSKGCTVTTSQVITQPDLLEASTTKTDVNCLESTNGTATASAVGGTGAYTYAWATTPVQTAATATGLGVGTYMVTVTDANGCTVSTSATITNLYPPPTPVIAGDTSVCCAEAITYWDTDADVNDGPLFTFQWTISGGTITYLNTYGSEVSVVWDCNCTEGWLQLTKTNTVTGCITTTPKYYVTVHAKPVPVITGPVSVITNTASSSYSVPFTAGHTYHWTVVGGSVATGQGTNAITVNWDWAPCQDCPSSVCVTESSEFYCQGTACIDVTQLPIPGSYKLSGQLTYFNAFGTPLNGVTITLLQGSTVVATTTTASGIDETDPMNPIPVLGYYEFNNLNAGNYTVQATSTKPWGGVNATDALLVKLHVVGSSLLGPVYSTAADANASSSITATDALLLQLRTVGLVSTFAAGDWVYNAGNVTLAGNMTYNILALTTGDVNGSYVPVTGAKAVNYTNLQKDGISLANYNSEIEVPIRVSDVLNLGAVTLDLLYNNKLVNVTAVNSQLSGFEYNIVDGKVMFAWASANAANLQANDILLTLTVRVKDAISSTTDIFSFTDNTEFANANGQILDFGSLKVNSIQTDSKTNNISVYPNPFKNNAEINYNLVESGSVRLSIYNAVGQVINVLVDENKAAGNYTYNLNTSELPSGVYTCELIINGQTSNYKKVIKLVRTK